MFYLSQTVFAVIFTFVGDIDVLINFISFLQWIFYGMNMLSVIIFRYKAKYKNLPRPFRVTYYFLPKRYKFITENNLQRTRRVVYRCSLKTYQCFYCHFLSFVT